MVSPEITCTQVTPNILSRLYVYIYAYTCSNNNQKEGINLRGSGSMEEAGRERHERGQWEDREEGNVEIIF